MKIVFFGISQYCLPVLESLHKNFDLALIITRPDKPVGRKQILTPSATKLWAKKNNVEVATPATLKNGTPDRKQTTQQLEQLRPDLAVVADYGLIIPEAIFTLPKLGTINIHFSKLPDLRGPSPVQFSLLRGDTTAWITIFKLENPPELKIKMDSGPILAQNSYPIDPDDTTENVYKKLFHEVSNVLPKVLADYLNNRVTLAAQDHQRASYCQLLTRQDGFIEYENVTNPENYNKFRAFYPWPGLWTIKDGKRMKILKCHLANKKLVLDLIQFEGKSPSSSKITLL